MIETQSHLQSPPERQLLRNASHDLRTPISQNKATWSLDAATMTNPGQSGGKRICVAMPAEG